jgi:hypothetical protein
MWSGHVGIGIARLQIPFEPAQGAFQSFDAVLRATIAAQAVTLVLEADELDCAL